MNYTDEQLRLCLAKMLPEKIVLIEAVAGVKPMLCWVKSPNNCLHRIIQDTEWLHVCWLVEQTLTDEQKLTYGCELLSLVGYNSVVIDGLIDDLKSFFAFYNASWQQRAIALAKVKGITKEDCMTDQQSDTPRTDANVNTRFEYGDWGAPTPIEYVFPEFARALERELNEANKKARSHELELNDMHELRRQLTLERDEWRKCAEQLAHTPLHNHHMTFSQGDGCETCKAMESFNELQQRIIQLEIDLQLQKHQQTQETNEHKES